MRFRLVLPAERQNSVCEGVLVEQICQMRQKLPKSSAKARCIQRQVPIRIVIAKTGSISKLSVSNFGTPVRSHRGGVRTAGQVKTKTFL